MTPPVADVPEANLFPQAFPADSFPQFVWEEGERPATLPEQAWTTETTHRDGQQGGLPLTEADGLAIYDLMGAFTGQSGALRQAEFFVYRPADRAMLEGALERWRGGHPVEPTTWIRATRGDAELVAGLGVRETGMLASASDYHTFYKFKPGGRAQAARTYLDAVGAVLDAGLRPRLHLEDATRAPREFILPFVAAVQELAARYPAQQAPKFRVCDTMGLGLPLDGVAWPRSIPGLVRELRAAGVDSERLEFHPHNDTHLVVANCLAAVLAGCAAINGTLLGKGERTGNAPLEGVLLHLVGLNLVGQGGSQRPDFAVLNRLNELYERLGQGVPAKYPLYGRDAHRTRAGIHADGLNKFWPMYAPFDVPGLLGRPLELSLTADSGLAGLIFLIRQHTGHELSKDDAGLRALHARLGADFEAGRQTAVEWEEIADEARAVVAGAPGQPVPSA
ncbi:pyruvate carboxyltransferase [Deinococcus radiopugnans]|uniref:2-phosphinomethylmalic acid synthase n=1 Tax=Deinococcus radiopugnans ATCC 19172 TaxID=585398 RepID=A0A5C4Y3N5_9DEIO|nr:pyruvate carboxyltransferase [Deinococcus radiopugnans]MBB6017613.1 2-phosphinomethylmalic acid synthase [Deinococcus radiopugnans ATCC 19172]TNM70379.1 pyruvate carboxyltransferase [Deinococcus radiopugnans ATCC 19172]